MADTALARVRFTLDSNILIYAFDREDAFRHRPAMEIVNRAVDADCWLTLQALSEFYAVTTRKRMLSLAEAAAQVEDWLVVFPCIAVSAAAVRRALADAVAGRASYWDALLVATAAESGCTVVLSEDMADGASFGRISVHNPFAAAGGLTARAQALLGL
ncbi:MAG TPA: PIN domain-containing protein [Stellaceae bacterium]|nr:PIN domain-containing protein [Stellaceae bacterium]